jgi:hypothetical protein
MNSYRPSIPTTLAIIVAACLSGSGCGTPGADRRGRELVAAGNRIVAAIESRRQATGVYPVSLAELSGSFDVGGSGSDHSFRYTLHDNNFQLELRYSPSWPQIGQVSCFLESDTKEWKCQGYT